MLCYTYEATSLCLNLAICLRYMKTWHYNRTDTMPISNTVIMIRSAGANFQSEYSERNLIVKTQCVKQMWLGGNSQASPVVSVSSKTRLTQLIQSSLQQSLQHGTVLAYIFVCPASFIPVTDPHTTKVRLLSHISP